MVLGLELDNRCIVSHGEQGTNVKRPFTFIPGLEMHEVSPGSLNEKLSIPNGINLASSFHGQFGFIPFTTTHRLPRHVHIAESPHDPSKQVLVTERILVLNGVALVELNGKIYIIAPGSLVSIAPGVPHTWNACPAGVRLPDGITSDGQFLMVYEYESPTGFFPMDQTASIRTAEEYREFTGNLESIRFPDLTTEEVVAQGTLIWGKQLRKAESQ